MKEDKSKNNEKNISFSSINEENKYDKELSEKKKTNIKINDKDNLLKNNIINNMEVSNNEIIEENISMSRNSIISKKEENKDDVMNLTRDQIEKMDIKSLYFLFNTKFNEQEKKFKEQEKKFKEQEKKFNEQFSKLKEENDKKFFDLQKDIKYLKNIVGSIQIRTFAKNFLSIFGKLLNDTEKEIIKSDNTKRGELTLVAIKRK